MVISYRTFCGKQLFYNNKSDIKASGLYSAVNDTATGTQDELTSITMSSRLAGIL